MKHISGIYSITCLANNKLYIGKSTSIKRRWKAHRNQLNQKKHCNSHLQNAWNLYGKEYFIFEIVEHCEKSLLSDRERYWITSKELLDPNKGFNCVIDFKRVSRPNRSPKIHKGRSIQAFKEGQLIGSYCSIIDCARNLNLPKNRIQEVCANKKYGTTKQKLSYKGFTFKYN